MTVLERAILNQKFIYEPAGRLLDHIPELEKLWDELTSEFYSRNWMVDNSFQQEVKFSPEFVSFLRLHLPRFYRAKTYTHRPRLPREHRILMLRNQIAMCQQELERVEAGNESPEETLPQSSERLQREYMEQLQAAANCLEFNSENRNGQFSYLISGYLWAGV